MVPANNKRLAARAHHADREAAVHHERVAASEVTGCHQRFAHQQARAARDEDGRQLEYAVPGYEREDPAAKAVVWRTSAKHGPKKQAVERQYDHGPDSPP